VKYIDTHAHVYSSDDAKYPPVENPTRPPGTSGTFAALEKLAQDNDVAKVCVIQPSSFYGWDNRFICDLALTTNSNTAAICSLNPDDPDTPALIKHLVKQYGIRGIRSLPASDGRINHLGVRNLWRACAEQGITVNVFIKRDKAPELLPLLREFRDVRCVIDHCLLLSAGIAQQETLDSMLELAIFPNAYAKLSFLPLGSAEEYPYADLHASCSKLINSFSSRRCVWGSNFPCELWTPRSTYRQNLNLFTSELGLDEQTQEDILWNTPNKLWFRE
jgi:L-fuconolactonase